MIEYKEILLSEIKSLLSYFMEFSKDELILPKIYLNNSVVGGSNQKLIIMIIYDKNTLSTNNGCQKV